MFEFWDTRYASADYAYGVEPNHFLKEQLQKINPGRILFPAEGEGRNAVFAAALGFDVVAFDPSVVGRQKAIKLAFQHQVSIDYLSESYESILLDRDSFDVVALIFAHIPAIYRTKYHRKLVEYLKPGGLLILEAFSKNQIHNNTGGPSDITMLFSEEELRYDFGSLKNTEIETTETYLNEGLFHQGIASVIRLTGNK